MVRRAAPEGSALGARLDLSHACSPECISTYGLVNKFHSSYVSIVIENAPSATSDIDSAIDCLIRSKSANAAELMVVVIDPGPVHAHAVRAPPGIARIVGVDLTWVLSVSSEMVAAINRPAVSEKRLSLTPSGNIRYQLITPYNEEPRTSSLSC
jgi:hypothetical protein